MNISLHDGPLAELECDALVVPLAGGAALGQSAEAQVAALRESGEIAGKPSELTILHEPKELAAKRLMLLGVGDSLDPNQAIRMDGQAVRE
ncbi:MAG: hypothetical protein OXS32_03080, partial [Verrucomicrobiales bacterium]|nr:hypothetical protein [Verrucomicrobiales bacterium]